MRRIYKIGFFTFIFLGMLAAVVYFDGRNGNKGTNVKRVPENMILVQGVVYKNSSADLISVNLPFPGAVVGKEFSVIGKARGMWYFEAIFPVELLDKDGKVLVKGIARAQGDWMTENFVPFKADLKAPESYIGPATLVLKRDNPSGMPEKDSSVSFPITVEY